MKNFDYARLANYKWDSEALSYVAKVHECKGRQDLFVRFTPLALYNGGRK